MNPATEHQKNTVEMGIMKLINVNRERGIDVRIVVIALLCVILLNLLAQEAFPRQRALTTKEKTLLRKAQTVYVQTVALTEKGLTKPDAIREVVARRFQEIGFSTAKTSH